MVATGLPDDGEAQLAGVRLPVGRQVAAGSSGVPVVWVSDEPVLDPGLLWQELSRASRVTGLVPFLAGTFYSERIAALEGWLRAAFAAGAAQLSRAELGRPWDSGELDDPADAVHLDHFDPAQVLSQAWQDTIPPDDEDDDWSRAQRVPFGRQFPGLAPAEEQPLSGDTIEQQLTRPEPARIGLAAATRPADVLPVIGWNGAANRHDNALPIAAVLRSWEDRFGAVLLQVGFAEITLLAQRPPRTTAAAQLLAAEQYAFSDECAGKGLHDIPAITDWLLTSPIWTFWWD